MSKTHPVDTNGSWNYTRRTASAFDEVRILAKMGRASWELTDLGALYLEFRRPADDKLATMWEYYRYSGLTHKGARRKMLAQGWEPAGQWANWLYFKRRLQP